MMPADVWPLQLSFSAFGAGFVIRGGDPALEPKLRNRLPFGSIAGPVTRPDRVYSLTEEDEHAVYVDDQLRRRAPTIDPVLRFLRRDLQHAVAYFARDFVFVHAGVVGWRGRAIVMPGPSRCGKSTLVAEFLKAGADYLSDEYALIDNTGSVRAFPRSLSLRIPTGGRSRTRVECDPDARLPVGAVILSQFRSGARWQPREAPTGEAILGLLANTVSARADPRRATEAAKHVAVRAVAFAGDRGEALDAVADILQHLENHQESQ
jgi:hypothetical protein